MHLYCIQWCIMNAFMLHTVVYLLQTGSPPLLQVNQGTWRTLYLPTSCVQLVYWIGQVSAISANTGISFWQYYRMYVFKFSIHILTIIGMVIGISRYLYFNISYLSISLNFILLWCNTSYTQKMQLEGNWPNYSLPFLPCLAPFWRWGECWSGETCTPHVG